MDGNNIQTLPLPNKQYKPLLRDTAKKPDEARKRIVQLLGDAPKIELFARERADGWDAWGDEIT